MSTCPIQGPPLQRDMSLSKHSVLAITERERHVGGLSHYTDVRAARDGASFMVYEPENHHDHGRPGRGYQC